MDAPTLALELPEPPQARSMQRMGMRTPDKSGASDAEKARCGAEWAEFRPYYADHISWVKGNLNLAFELIGHQCRTCGAFDTERRRAAASDYGAGDSRERPRSSAAHGWASLRWHARPTRAGWWILKCKRHWQIIEVYRKRPGRELKCVMAGSGYVFTPGDLPGEWAGPVKPEQLIRALTTPNGETSDRSGGRA